METIYLLKSEKGYFKYELHCAVHFTNNPKDAEIFSEFSAKEKARFLKKYLGVNFEICKQAI